MGRLLNLNSKLKIHIICRLFLELFKLDPKPSDLPFGRLKFTLNRSGGPNPYMLQYVGMVPVGRGERLIKLGYSWFLAKTI